MYMSVASCKRVADLVNVELYQLTIIDTHSLPHIRLVEAESFINYSSVQNGH